MRKDDSVYLSDILVAIGKIEDYVSGKKYLDFVNSPILQDAVIRQLEVLGEAAKRVSLELKNKHKNISFAEASAMRNLLIHEYDCVNVDIIWKTIKSDLIKFKLQILRILK